MESPDVGLRVRAARFYRGLEKQSDLVARLTERGYQDAGLGVGTIGKIERGERPVRLHEAEAICASLDLPLAFLLGEVYQEGATKEDVRALARELHDLESRLASRLHNPS